jgi:hypothetical protein
VAKCGPRVQVASPPARLFPPGVFPRYHAGGAVIRKSTGDAAIAMIKRGGRLRFISGVTQAPYVVFKLDPTADDEPRLKYRMVPDPGPQWLAPVALSKDKTAAYDKAVRMVLTIKNLAPADRSVLAHHVRVLRACIPRILFPAMEELANDAASAPNQLNGRDFFTAPKAMIGHNVEEGTLPAADSFTMHGLLKHLFVKRDELAAAASLADARDKARRGFLDAPPAATPVVAARVPELVDALAQFYYAGFIIPPGSIVLGDLLSLDEWKPPGAARGAAGQGGEVPDE